MGGQYTQTTARTGTKHGIKSCDGDPMKEVWEEYTGKYQSVRVYYVPDDYPVEPMHIKLGPDQWFIRSVRVVER